MRILVTANPLWGHVLPMIPLVRAALARGHEVAVATGADLVGPLRARGIEVWPVGPSAAEVFTPALRRFDSVVDPVERQIRTGREIFLRPAVRRVREIIPSARAWRPDVVVHELAELAGPEIAAATGALGVVHGWGTHIDQLALLAGRLLGELSDELDRPGRGEHFFHTPYLDPCPPLLQSDSPFRDVWPVRPTVGEVLPGERLPRSMTGLPYERSVYVTLGTLRGAESAELAQIVDALQDLPLNLLVTTGPDLDPAALGPRPAHVAVERFVPQALVLPEVDALVSHAGSGTMLGALVSGLPQVCRPLGADQFANAQQVARSGAGVSLVRDEVTATALRAAVRTVLDDPSFAIRARAVARDVADMPDAAAIVARLEDLASHAQSA